MLGKTIRQFEDDALEAIKAFPSLELCYDNEKPFLKGELPIHDKLGKEWDRYKIRIEPSPAYPYAFPNVFDLEQRMPYIPDWHMYSDGSCCFDVPMSEYLKCRSGMRLVPFLQHVAVPFFADQTFRLKEGYYQGKEYSHGLDGICEFFASKLECSNDKKTVANHLRRYLYFQQRPQKRRNFINEPKGWGLMDKLPISQIQKWEKIIRSRI